MTIKTKLSFAAAALLLAGSASANTVVVTQEGRLVALDFQSTGDVSAFQFTVDLPKGVTNIDTSKCLSDLPKGYTGVCRAKGNRVAAVVYSGDNKPFPADVVSLGTLNFRGSIAKGTDEIVVSNMVGSTPSGAEAASMKSDVSGQRARGTHEK